MLWIGGYLLIQMIDNIRTYGINLSGIIKIVICTVMVLAGFFGLIDIIKNAVSFKKSVFYVKTCRIVGMRGETPRKRTTWYVTVLDGDQETEYCCRNNPFYSDEEIAAKREITIATFDDVNDEDEISMVYILDQVYPNYRNPA